MKVFQFFEVFPSLDLPGCTGQFFLRRLPQNKFETCLDTFKNVLDTFEKSNFFSIFLRIFIKFDLQVALGKKISEKITSSKFGHFWKGFSGFWNFEIFSIFVDFFWVSCVHWTQRFPSKNSIKTMFLGTFSDNFESFEVFRFFKVFSKPRPSKVHWRLFFETKLPQNRFRTCLDNIRDSFGHFRNIEFFHFFQSFPYSTPQGALCKIFTQKITSKRVQNMFDCFWERFLGILKNWRFFQFFGVFPSFDSPGCTGQFFPKKSPQNKFKTCLDTFRKVFGHFRVFKFFRFFFRIFPSFDHRGCTGQFVFTEKTTSKHVQNVFELFGERFWAFWKKNESFSIFLTFFLVSTLQRALGKIFFQKNTSKPVQHLFGNF